MKIITYGYFIMIIWITVDDDIDIHAGKINWIGYFDENL